MLHELGFCILYSVLVTFFGHAVHWMLHQKWSGRLFKSHMIHHYKLYPIKDFESIEYRSAGKDSTTKTFVVFSIPVAVLPFVVSYFGFIPITIAILSFAIGIIIGLFNDWAHDSYHVIGHPLRKLPMWKYWRDMHYQHHADTTKNYGIWYFFWDRLFKTYKILEEKSKKILF